jgi:hypothetical protein
MNFEFLPVYGAWLGFLIIHSLLAAPQIKDASTNRFGIERYRFARILLTTFALACVLVYHWTVFAPTLVNLGLVYRFFGLAIMISGFILVLSYLKNMVYNNSLLPRPILQKDYKPTLRVIIRNRIKQHINDYSFFRVRFPGYTGALLFTCGYPFYFPTEKNFITVAMLAIYFIFRLINEENKAASRVAQLASQKLNVYKAISYSVQKRVS